MIAHEHRLARRRPRWLVWWRTDDGRRPALYCVVVGCPLALAAPSGMPDYRRAGVRRWA